MKEPWKLVLVVEDDSDGKALRALAESMDVAGTIDWLPAGGIGEIKRRGRELIGLARDRLVGKGCVAVLLDRDGKDVGQDEPHRSIARICRAKGVPLVLACEALEAWLLADPGVCKWLRIRQPANTATLANPKRTVADAYRKRTGSEYGRRLARVRLARQATGPSPDHNASLAAGLEHIARSGCLPESPLPQRRRRASGTGRPRAGS